MTNKKQICTDGCDVCFMRMSLLMAVLFAISIYAHATPFQGLKKDSLFYSYDEKAVNGTTGTPLGGFGCGAVKFDANTGRFAVMTAPPADAYDFVRKKDALLQFYSKRDGHIEVRDTLKACLVNGRPADDAVWPLHFVDFGNINGVRVEMTGISPLDNRNYDNMHLPYALYEVVLTNTEDSDVTAAFAFKWSSKGQPFSILPGKGIYSDEWSLMAACGHPGSAISIGDDKAGMFLRQGFCDDSRMRASVQKVSVTTTLSAHETRRIHFVLAWYNRTDPEIGYYMNLYKAPKEIAEHGLSVFSLLKDNAERLVLGMRRSNLPDWLKNQTLNTLVNVVNNSMYKRDGRVAFSEGQWTCFGTMDQMWLARQIISQLLPSYAWQELNYWARTQMRNGQIHHDFNAMDAGDKREKRSVLVSWDDTEHADYRNIQKWVDLNCGFIISVYEIYKATADRKQFDCLWPYVKKAAQRILVQVEQYGSKQYPFTFDDSENSYDAGGNPNPYNANLSAATYKIMVSLAKEKGETALAATFEHAFNVVKESFHNRYVRDKETLTGKHCESVFAGQWLACHLKLGEIWSVEDTDFILQQLDNYYYPFYYGLGYPQGTYDEWTPYILVHYGGLMLHAGRLEEWYVMQKDAYFRQYLDRNKVFAHPLNILPMVNTPKWISTNIKSKMQYISMPALWRNYYDIIGYHRDARTGELWIKPILHRSMNGRLEDAMFVSPEGCGYIDYEEEQKGGRLSKVVTVKTERPMTVSTLYLTDNFKGDVSVSIDGHPCTYRKTGAGYGKEIAIDCHRQITDKGICVIVQGRPEVKKVSRPAIPENGLTQAVSVNPMSPYEVMEAEKADKQVGTQIVQSDGNEYVTSCNNFDYVQFSNVDFSRKGATTFKGRFLGLAENAEVEIVLDDTSGTVIGSCRIPHSAGTWTKIKCPVEKVTGVHNVIVKFYGNHSDDLMNMDWIQFE